MQKDYTTEDVASFNNLTPLVGQQFYKARGDELLIVAEAARCLEDSPSKLAMLDVGCGCGEIVRWADRHLGFGLVTGVDRSARNATKAICEIARFPSAENSEIVYADIRCMTGGRARRKYDLVIALGSLEHDEDGMRSSLENIHSLMNRNGVVLVSVPWQSPRHVLFNKSYSSVSGLSQLDVTSRVFYQYRFTKPELKRELRLAGFVPIRCGTYNKLENIRRAVSFVMPFLSRKSWTHKIVSSFLEIFVPNFVAAHMMYVIAVKV